MLWQYLAQSNLVICVETIRESYNNFRAKYRRARGTIQTYLRRFSVRKYSNYWSRINKVNTTYWNLIFDQPWVKNSCFFPVLKYRRITSASSRSNAPGAANSSTPVLPSNHPSGHTPSKRKRSAAPPAVNNQSFPNNANANVRVI